MLATLHNLYPVLNPPPVQCTARYLNAGPSTQHLTRLITTFNIEVEVSSLQ